MFKDVAEKLSGSWVPLVDDVELNITMTTSETSDDGHFLTTVTYQINAVLLQIARKLSGEKGDSSVKNFRSRQGALAVESTLEDGVWMHRFNISRYSARAQELVMQIGGMC